MVELLDVVTSLWLLNVDVEVLVLVLVVLLLDE